MPHDFFFYFTYGIKNTENISVLILLSDASETFMMRCNEASASLINNTTEISQRGRKKSVESTKTAEVLSWLKLFYGVLRNGR